MTDSKKPHFGGVFQIQQGAQGAANVKFSMPAWGGAFKPAAPAAVLPQDAQGCNSLGNERLLANRLHEALQAYDRAIALQPDYVDPHFNRSSALLRLNRLPEALAALDDGRIDNAASIIALQWLALNRDKVRERWA